MGPRGVVERHLLSIRHLFHGIPVAFFAVIADLGIELLTGPVGDSSEGARRRVVGSAGANIRILRATVCVPSSAGSSRAGAWERFQFRAARSATLHHALVECPWSIWARIFLLGCSGRQHEQPSCSAGAHRRAAGRKIFEIEDAVFAALVPAWALPVVLLRKGLCGKRFLFQVPSAKLEQHRWASSFRSKRSARAHRCLLMRNSYLQLASFLSKVCPGERLESLRMRLRFCCCISCHRSGATCCQRAACLLRVRGLLRQSQARVSRGECARAAAGRRGGPQRV